MINWSRVKELQEDIGADEIGEVVELILEEVEEVIGRLASSPVEAELEQDMHFLKGCALNLGFDQLGNMCSVAEKLAGKGQVQDIPIAGILEMYAQSKEVFLSQIGTV